MHRYFRGIIIPILGLFVSNIPLFAANPTPAQVQEEFDDDDDDEMDEDVLILEEDVDDEEPQN